MLVENTEPRARSVAGFILIPGINSIPDSDWEKAAENPKWKNVIKGLVRTGVLRTTNSAAKLTVEIVEKTLDINLLNTWLEDKTIKGKLRQAVEKQVDLMSVEGL